MILGFIKKTSLKHSYDIQKLTIDSFKKLPLISVLLSNNKYKHLKNHLRINTFLQNFQSKVLTNLPTSLTKNFIKPKFTTNYSYFSNNSFFDMESSFNKKTLFLTGTSISRNTYELSNTNDWKIDLITPQLVTRQLAYRPRFPKTSRVRRLLKKTKNLSNFKKNLKKQWHYPFTLKLHRLNAYALKRRLRSKTFKKKQLHFKSRKTRFTRIPSRKLKKAKGGQKKKSAQLRIKLLKLKIRKFNQSPKKKNKFQWEGKPNLKVISSHSYRYKKHPRNRWKRFLRHEFHFFKKNPFFNKFNFLRNPNSSTLNTRFLKYTMPILKWHRIHFYTQYTKRSMSQKKLKKLLRVKKGFKRFIKFAFPFIYKIRDPQIIKHQSFRQRRKKWFSKKLIRFRKLRIRIKNALNPRFFKYVNFKLKKKLTKIVALASITKPKDIKKWKHNKPYSYTNNKNLKKYNSRLILDTYLYRNLQPFTTFKKRAKRLKFYSSSKSHKYRKLKLNTTLSKNVRPKKLKVKNLNKVNVRWQIYKFCPSLHTQKSSAARRIKSFKKKKFSKNDSWHQTQAKKLLTSKSQTKLRIHLIMKKKRTANDLSNHLIIKNNAIKNKTARFKKLRKRMNLSLTLPQKLTNKEKSLIEIIRLTSFKIALPAKKLRYKKKSMSLKTRSNQTFTLKSPIMFFKQFVLKSSFRKQTPKFVFKKLVFSFFKPNEVRRNLMNLKKKFHIYNLVFREKILRRSNSTFKPSTLKQIYKNSNYYNLYNSKLSSNPASEETQHTFNSTKFSLDIVNTDVFSSKGYDFTLKRPEVKIPRVRFKPGYRRLWRQSRSALKEALRVKFTYQKRLTQYITRFFKASNYYAFSASEMSIDKTIVYTRLLPDMLTLEIFLEQRLVYLNGFHVTNKHLIIYENDLIQLIVSKWYYAAYRWISNWTLQRVKKYKRLMYRKGLSSKYKLMKQRKQKSFYVPHWIYLTRHDLADIKPYLEVDYLTLSAVLIYNPYILDYHTPTEIAEYRPNVHRLYNWKYIT